MTDVTERALRVLGLLQSHDSIGGPALAAELGVTLRTVRRDVERLRRMGYPITASRGSEGGYRLGAGRALPPLMLSREQATAVAVGLRLASASGVAGLEAHALGALASLDAVLPPPVRAEVEAVTASLGVLGGRAPAVPSSVLTTLTRSIAEGVQLRLVYERRDGERSERRIEPYRVLTVTGHWYLFAWDLDREDWRSFRLDRMRDARATTFRFAARPTPDIDRHVRESITVGGYAAVVRAVVDRPREEVERLIPPRAASVDAVDGARCVVHAGGADPREVLWHLARLDLPVIAIDPPELAAEAARLADWFCRVGPARTGGGIAEPG